MNELFFGGGAGWFTTAALIGTLFFVGRLVLMFAGGADWSPDVDVDVDVDVDAASDFDHGDSAEAFKVLSLQGIAAFLMGFGWGGLGGLQGAGWGVAESLSVGLVSGAGMVWLLGKLLKIVMGFQSSGTLEIEDALGAHGTVYASIPPAGDGLGRVRVVMGDRERFYRAVSDAGSVATGTRIEVIDINEDNTVTVAPVESARDLVEGG